MYQGTTIEELIRMVKQAEDQAQVEHLAEMPDDYSRGFVYELPRPQAVPIGVA